MNIVFVNLGLIVLAIIGFAVYRYQKVKGQRQRLNADRFERVRGLYGKLESGQRLTAEDVLPYATNVLTREPTFELLKSYNQLALFPGELLTLEKGAESRLVNWLEYPTELDGCPDEIRHFKRVSFDFDGEGHFVHYEVFKYRINEPHWAAKNGWIWGVVGPYFDDSQPYDHAAATFSRVDSTVDKISADEEAKWVHEHIASRG
jgi:hypothetical protein